MCRSNKEFVALVEIFEPQVIFKVFEYSILGIKPNREPPHPLPKTSQREMLVHLLGPG